MQFSTFRTDFLPNLPEDLAELILYVRWGFDDASVALAPGEGAVAMWGLERPLLARLPRLRWLTLNVPAVPCDDAAAALAAAAVCFPRAHALGVLRVSVVVWELEWCVPSEPCPAVRR